MLSNRPLGLLYALLAVTIWSGNFIIASGFVGIVPPITLAALRWTTASLFLFPFAAKSMRRDMAALLEHKYSLLAAAFTGVTVFNTLVYISAWTTDTVNLALLASITPVFVVILARIFLKETISPLRTVGLLVAICGMMIIATRGNMDVLLGLTFRAGDLWMLFAGFLWAIYSILVKRKPDTISRKSYLGAIFFLGVIPLIPAALIEQHFYPAWSVTPAIVGVMLYIGIGASLIAFILWNSAIMLIGPGTSALFQYFIPVFSGIGAYFLLGQPITWAHAAGFVLIFSGVAMATRSR
ncbi:MULTISPECIES: DMT family transporter [unclassified Pseudodesulfovibrio]|uniref:DMT family transporter n=1 Tax=unclassified Pseudodesulfovibrio TaxID=2661612 RepID=UPI000FEBFD88|nr:MULTISPECIES: DMT family transporter [unclassified Pseudodesulfovibrio]MCJ2163929.1 DMT family transporter [Pseudodesulfovibrio sp. S3-i]RWU05826.1 DMT family transporter [Pseudodesulfovibrio sp. S3]